MFVGGIPVKIESKIEQLSLIIRCGWFHCNLGFPFPSAILASEYVWTL